MFAVRLKINVSRAMRLVDRRWTVVINALGFAPIVRHRRVIRHAMRHVASFNHAATIVMLSESIQSLFVRPC